MSNTRSHVSMLGRRTLDDSLGCPCPGGESASEWESFCHACRSVDVIKQSSRYRYDFVVACSVCFCPSQTYRLRKLGPAPRPSCSFAAPCRLLQLTFCGPFIALRSPNPPPPRLCQASGPEGCADSLHMVGVDVPSLYKGSALSGILVLGSQATSVAIPPAPRIPNSRRPRVRNRGPPPTEKSCVLKELSRMKDIESTLEWKLVYECSFLTRKSRVAFLGQSRWE